MSFLEIWHGIDPWSASGLYIIQVAPALVPLSPSILWKNTTRQEMVTRLHVIKARRRVSLPGKQQLLCSQKMPQHWDAVLISVLIKYKDLDFPFILHWHFTDRENKSKKKPKTKQNTHNFKTHTRVALNLSRHVLFSEQSTYMCLYK